VCIACFQSKKGQILLQDALLVFAVVFFFIFAAGLWVKTANSHDFGVPTSKEIKSCPTTKNTILVGTEISIPPTPIKMPS
jgi:hypothetical protein